MRLSWGRPPSAKRPLQPATGSECCTRQPTCGWGMGDRRWRQGCRAIGEWSGQSPLGNLPCWALPGRSKACGVCVSTLTTSPLASWFNIVSSLRYGQDLSLDPSTWRGFVALGWTHTVGIIPVWHVPDISSHTQPHCRTPLTKSSIPPLLPGPPPDPAGKSHPTHPILSLSHPLPRSCLAATSRPRRRRSAQARRAWHPPSGPSSSPAPRGPWTMTSPPPSPR